MQLSVICFNMPLHRTHSEIGMLTYVITPGKQVYLFHPRGQDCYLNIKETDKARFRKQKQFQTLHDMPGTSEGKRFLSEFG
jgi:hypothetical protein